MAVVETASYRDARTFMPVAALLIGGIHGDHRLGRGLILDHAMVGARGMAETGRLKYPTGLGCGTRGILAGCVSLTNCQTAPCQNQSHPNQEEG